MSQTSTRLARGAGHGSSGRLASWLASHRRLVVGTIVAASVVVRVTSFVELASGPVIWQHRWEQTDMYFFDVWARHIAEGDWLTDRSLHPYLGWHREIAGAYLLERPEEAARLEGLRGPEGSPPDPSRLLWDRWYGGKRFHQGPLYPYLIGLTYRVLGPDARWVFAWQMALGALSNVLIYLIARRYFGDAVGALAGGLAVLASPLLFYETILLRSAPVTFMGLLLVYLAERALERSHWRRWLLCGIALGLALVLKSTFAIFGLGALCLLVWAHRRLPGELGRSALALAAGAALALSPFVARNVRVGAPPLGFSSVGALAFICSNTEDYPPGAGFFIGSKHLRPILAVGGGRLLPSVAETLRTHRSIGSYLKQLWGKFAECWHWYEKPNNNNFYYSRLHSLILRYLPVTFLLIAPLGLAGLALAAPRISRAAPLYLLVLNGLAPLVLFYVLSRFRSPLAAALIPFAAVTLARLAGWVRDRRVARSALLAGALALTALWTARPLPENRALVSPVYYSVPFKVYYAPAVDRAAARADWQRVVDLIDRSLRVEPAAVREMGAGRPARTREEAQLAGLFALWRGNRARALRELGRPDAAGSEERRVKELRRAAAARAGPENGDPDSRGRRPRGRG